MVIYLPVKFEFDWTNCFRVRVRKQKCGRTDGCRTHQSNRLHATRLIKITHRKRYIKKQKLDTTKDGELDLLGDEDVESFTGSQADLESATDNLFTSPPRPQPLPFESLSIKTAKSVPPTQVLPHNRRLSPSSKSPWVTHLTSIYSNKWAFFRLPC